MTTTTKQLAEITDRDITLALEEDLQASDGVPAHLIDVQTKNGIVILSGTVQNLQAKERACEVAEMIKGVRAVVNRIEVKPVVRPDDDVYTDIMKALFFDPATHAYAIDVTVKDGVVTLEGAVESQAKKELTEWVVKGVRGVKAINNAISVEPVAQRLDNEIAEEIKRRLALDVWLDEALIEVEVQDGTVTLSGVVGSAIERTRAYLNAWVDGVTSVNSNALTAEMRDRDELRQPSKFALRTDEEIKWAVEGAFLYDPRLIGFNVEVDVRGGVVTLTGVVDNLRAKQSAEQDAGNTIGVWQVKNYLKVRPVQPPDDLEIAEYVREVLLWNPDVDRHQIVVSCHDGQVYLSGTVSSQYEKDQAEDVANRVRGVVEVINNLRVDQTWRWKSDEQIKQAIESRLQYSPFVDTGQIAVTVEDGIATLSGVVDIWQKRDFLIDQALKGGAKSVSSRLNVEYGTDAA
ncbi:MAG: BON domain-containing protein [Anaerolineae bacterium]|nr:BON domain-containing protein [Anaerolineae bacterium]